MNSITVGVRSDGQISLTSSPNNPGPVPVQCFVFPKDTAVWLAHQILRMVESLPDTAPTATSCVTPEVK